MANINMGEKMSPLQAAIIISEVIDGKAYSSGYGALVDSEDLKITIERKNNVEISYLHGICGDNVCTLCNQTERTG